MHREMPIGAAIALLKKEIAEKQSALNVLEALVTNGATSAPGSTANGPPYRGRKRTKGVGRAAVEILRSAGRPMHGLREIIPALEGQGYKIKNRAGLATTFLRTGQIERTSPGTFAYKGGPSEAH